MNEESNQEIDLIISKFSGFIRRTMANAQNKISSARDPVSAMRAVNDANRECATKIQSEAQRIMLQYGDKPNADLLRRRVQSAIGR